MKAYQEIKEKAWEANMVLSRSGLVIQTFGNVSAFEPDHVVLAIKPSGVPYQELRIEHMVVVDLNGKTVAGTLNPSSDTYVHAMLYNHFHGIGGVCHTHSTYATAWAQAVKPIPVLGTTHADYLATDIPCTEVMADKEIKQNYETETGNQIIHTFKKYSYKEVEMVLVACHGPFTWGGSADQAVRNSIVLEELAKMAFITLQIDPEANKLKKSLIDKHYSRKHGKNAYYGQQ